MFLLASENSSGAYAVVDANDDHVLFLFEEEDDAERYLMLLHENNEKHKKLSVVEVDDELALKACDAYNYKYAVIGPEDIVIPPNENDSV
jgi:ABC-type Fe3+ transport system substrate-binding protein